MVSYREVAWAHYCTVCCTNDMPLVLREASIAAFADDYAVYESSTSVDEFNLGWILHWVTKK